MEVKTREQKNIPPSVSMGNGEERVGSLVTAWIGRQTREHSPQTKGGDLVTRGGKGAGKGKRRAKDGGTPVVCHVQKKSQLKQQQ